MIQNFNKHFESLVRKLITREEPANNIIQEFSQQLSNMLDRFFVAYEQDFDSLRS